MDGGRGSWWRYAPIALIAVGLLLAYWLGAHQYLSLDHLYAKRMALKAFVVDNLALSAAGFCFFYAIAIAFVFPAPVILTVAAGFLFGWWLGGLLAITGATIGGSALFLAARSAFGDVLRRRAGGAIKRFAEGFRRDAFTYLLVLRLTPVLPVAALNIGPAFFDISLRSFALATFLGIIPGAMVYAFLGSGLDRALKIAGKSENLAIHDLMTVELTVALVGLTLLSLVGIALRKWLLRPGVTEGEPETVPAGKAAPR
ncbi:MAG: TVP38/TMEM64 family protein [Rhizobiaceae bacterium]|nr:TVP38/TMEM64 family protein [Rhizobiaceae bacterium]